MEAVYQRSAGLDVHKKSVTACRILADKGHGWQKETKRFGTMTADILAMADWLREGSVTHVAMESTGVYWKPIFNILEGDFDVILVNAKHIKYVPGRKTDVSDAQWIAELLQHGLLKASFIPEAPQRELRELVRYRTALIRERAREVNRVQKVLEDANIKLASVASDVMGVSGREMLAAVIAGNDDPEALAQLAKGRMRNKIAELERALTGRVKDNHRLLLRLHLEHIDELNAKLEELNQEIDRLVAPFNQNDEIERLDGIPGVGKEVAQVIVAELGTDMSRFPSSGHAASWAGLAPGKNESAGKNRSGKTPPGNRHLKTMLLQAAHAAGRSRDNYLSAQFRRLASRRGKKRAAVAVAHSILVIAYHMLRDGTDYRELGGDYFDNRNKDQIQRGLVRRLEGLGLKVTLEPAAVAT
ncbi:MAG: IS110 family transposase [Candidatus Promineifilaceae bacterium]|jgi:transposase